MPRRDLGNAERQWRDAPVIWEIQQAQYVHPGVATVGPVFPVDSSARFIAIPPVPNTGSTVLDATNPNRAPDMFEIWRRNNDYYLRLDTVADSRYAGAIPGDTVHRYAINPGVQTISVVAVDGTDRLNLNWLWTM